MAVAAACCVSSEAATTVGVEICRVVGLSVPGGSPPQPVSKTAAIYRHVARGSNVGLPVRVRNTTFERPSQC